MADTSVTPEVTVEGADGTSISLSGEHGHLVLETSWANLDAGAWERLKAEGDRLLALAQQAEAEYMADPEGYCTACGENAGWFIGYDGPRHFRGPHKLVTGAERRELFTPEDGHAPQVAWRQPGVLPDGDAAPVDGEGSDLD